MKPEPSQRTPTPDYPSFRKFHINRKTIVAGTAVAATASVLTGCYKTAGVPRCPAGAETNDSSGKITIAPMPEGETAPVLEPIYLDGVMIAPAPPEPDPQETNRIYRLRGDLPMPQPPEAE